MGQVKSIDGTKISFDELGKGSPVVLVDGALRYRRVGPMPGLARALESRFRVFTYRRGRGESGDTRPYTVSREVEDLEAIIAHVAVPRPFTDSPQGPHSRCKPPLEVLASRGW